MLSKETIDRIDNDAMQYVGASDMKDYDHEMRTMKSSYIAGATAESLRALPIVEALEKIRYGIFPMSNMEAINFINNAMNIAAEALDNYKNNK